mmetsp:Transcript_5664/g.22919  ORF Transcript_5664/g.22919 Transcript_5664/m.22919 type:complete len:253 (-) Transcript_5664:213-971(-)
MVGTYGAGAPFPASRSSRSFSSASRFAFSAAAFERLDIGLASFSSSPSPSSFSARARSSSNSSIACTSTDCSSTPQRPVFLALNASTNEGGPMPVMVDRAARAASSASGAGSPSVTVTATCLFRMESSAIWFATCRYLTSRSNVYWQHRTGMRFCFSFSAVGSERKCAGEARPASAMVSSPCASSWSDANRRWNSRASSGTSAATSSRWQYTNIGYSTRRSSGLYRSSEWCVHSRSRRYPSMSASGSLSASL